MDNDPKDPPNLVVTDPDALIAKVKRAQEAIDIANAAPAVEVTDSNGRPVKSLKLKLSAEETIRVMMLPAAERAATATAILQERQALKEVRRAADKERASARRRAKTRRKRQTQSRRRNR